ncbi:MAG: hypothetical protein KBF88_01900 [Polyangiaceae bacterium]|nr:hypothetical protein [Polyangiaceae bacterium]
MKTNKTFTIAALLLGSALIACSSGGGLGGGEDGEVDPAGTPGGIPDTSGTGSSGVTPPDENVSPSVGGGPGGPGMLCAAGRDYKDPGGFSLISGAPEKDRPVNVMGFDRDRVKPFAAYSEDLRKAVGRNPASLNGAATTFGNVPDRWFEEPSSSAIGLFTAYRIAFDGCQGLVNDAAVRAKYMIAPDVATATTECTAWARKYWSKSISPDELAACVKIATVDSVSEKDDRSGALTPTTSPRRWAYTCASVLTSAGFLTY